MNDQPQNTKLTREAELQLLFQEAQSLADAGQSAEALVAFDRLIARDPAMPAGYYFKGLLFGNLGRHEEAAFSLKKALERAPAAPTILFNFALSCLHTERWQAAMLSLLRFLQYGTGGVQWRAHLLLGVAASFHSGLGLFHDFDEFLAGEGVVQREAQSAGYFVDPNDALTTALLALSYAAQGNVAERQNCLAVLAGNGEEAWIARIEPVLDDLTRWGALHKTPATASASAAMGQENGRRSA